MATAALRIDLGERSRPEAAPEALSPLAIAHQRLMVIMLMFMLLTAVIAARLVQICLFTGDDGRAAAAPAAQRGEIYDRNGRPLATTIKLWSVAVNPSQVLGDRAALAVKLNALMPERSVAWYRHILFDTKRYRYLRRPAPPELAQAVQALGEPGMKLAPEPHRLFPQSAMAGHVLGFSQLVVDPNGKEVRSGLGIERYFDDRLAAGQPVTLSLDMRVQAALQGEIERRMAEVSAVGGGGVVLDVHTGEVLAMASLPDINPNLPQRSRPEDVPNKVTQSIYELGSTFKMLTFANALETGVLGDMSQRIDVSHPLHVGGHTIHDDEPLKRSITIPEVMTFSSNIGTAQIADQLGADRTAAFFRKLGFDERPQIELRERGKPLFPSYWARTTVMTTAYGHGIAVTPLHLATVYAALANGGILRPATLLKRQPGVEAPGRRVISEATSARIRQLMRLVVLQGTGTNANAPGLRVGGKTGTAEKIVGGRYVKSANVTTFAGAFPMDDPKYVILVVLDDAKASKGTYGFKTAGWMTAPLAKRVVARIGPLLGVRPDLSRDIDVSELMALLAEKKDPNKNVVE